MRSLKSSIGNLQSSMLSLLLAAGMLAALAPRAEAATGGGGNSTNDIGSDWRYHTFTNNGQFTVSGGDLLVQYLVVAGGGGGGYHTGGGGGAGGLLWGSATMTNGVSYDVNVGTGGVAGTSSGGQNSGKNGGNSWITNVVTVYGGGGGGSRNSGGAGLSGGSGGGGGAGLDGQSGGGAGNTPATTPSQGNKGGAAWPDAWSYAGGGGGGAGGPGGDSDQVYYYDNRGAPVTNLITGSAVAYAQGGGGSFYGSGVGGAAVAGIGGGATSGMDGMNGTGGGGGGGESSPVGRGGDGIVIIRYFTGTDSTPPTVTSFDDGNLGRPVCPQFIQMIYTVKFSEEVTLPRTNDFDNAGTAGITVDSVTRSADSFLVKVTPTSTGTLILRVKAAGTSIRDFAGNYLGVDGTDDTTVSVVANEPCSYGLVGWTNQIVGGTNVFQFTSSAFGAPAPFLAIWGGSGKDANYLVVAGGGGGGPQWGGGGGAGGLLYGTTNLLATNYTITVGIGGTNGTHLASSGGRGLNGRDTKILLGGIANVVTVNGGGGGGTRNGTAAGLPGGSGGGGGNGNVPLTGGDGNTPATTPSQGNNGGAGCEANTYMGGGGGGAGGPGGDANTTAWYDNRGAPVTKSITGSAVAYAQGGGGGWNSAQAGIGGGATVGADGMNGTGGGGGGAGAGGSPAAGRGGDGIVILAFPPQSVTVTWPTNSASFESYASITATAKVVNAASPAVTFYTNKVGDVGWGSASGSDAGGGVFINALGTLTPGSWQIYAKLEATGGTNYSSTNIFTVNAYSPLSVSLTSPTNGQQFMQGFTIPAVATASGGNGSHTVFFYTNSSLSGTFGVVNAGGDNSAPYSANLSSAVTGTKYVYAMVVDGISTTNYSPTTNRYVITPPTEVQATGGTMTNYWVGDTNWTAHIFTNTGTTNLNVTSGGSGYVQVLVVAGGGGGGSFGGGGGAGGVVYSNNYVVVGGSNYTVTVGGGGSSGIYNPGTHGGNGTNSVFGTLTAYGGGGGGNRDSGGKDGYGGGSGGGGSPASGAAGSATNSEAQGKNGGTGGGQWGGGGGGGAGSRGFAGNWDDGGDGGTGTYYSAFAAVAGSPAGWFAGGGGGCTYNGGTAHYGEGGQGGGGSSKRSANADPGTDNTGGGGGGADYTYKGGRGGSGIVIVRYQYTPPSQGTLFLLR